MTVRVAFTDGTEKDFLHCDDLRVADEYPCFVIEHSSGCLIMLPFVNVKYIGYKEDVQ